MTRYREQPWPWQLHAFLAFLAAFAVFYAALLGSLGSAMVAGAIIAAMVWDVARGRRVELDREGLVVAAQRFAWAELEVPHFREAPLARAGMFVRLNEAARAARGLPPPRHRIDGIGLERPAHGADVRYDLFVRARGAQLEAWHDHILVHLMADMGRGLSAIKVPGVPAKASPVVPGVVARMVVLGDDSATVELRAPSIASLVAGAEAALAAALPSELRWDPRSVRGVMVLVGPLELGSEAEAPAALEHVKACVARAVAGTPRAIEVIFAARG